MKQTENTGVLPEKAKPNCGGSRKFASPPVIMNRYNALPITGGMEWKLREFFVYVFSVSNLHNQYDQPVIVYFIYYNTIVAGSNFMKRIIPFHFGCIWVRHFYAKFFDLFFDFYQVTFGKSLQYFQYGRSKFYGILH